MFLKEDWIYHNYFNSYSSYKYNLKNLFTRGDEVKVDFPKGSVWGILVNNSGLAQTINNKVPIININDSVDNKYTKKLLNKKLAKATHIYTLVDSLDFEDLINKLNNTEYKIVGVKDVITSTIISRKDSFTYIFELEKNNMNSNNYESVELEKEIDVENINNIKFFIGLDKWFNNAGYSEDIPFTIYGDDEIITNILVDKDGMLNLVDLDVSKYKKITIKNDSCWFMILNREEW